MLGSETRQPIGGRGGRLITIESSRGRCSADKRIGWTPWLDVFCPGCGTSRAIDLRKVDRHPLASVATLVLGLRCAWCPEAVSMPRILGLHTLPPPAKAVASNLDPGTLSNPRRSGGLHRGPPKPRCRPPSWRHPFGGQLPDPGPAQSRRRRERRHRAVRRRARGSAPDLVVLNPVGAGRADGLRAATGPKRNDAAAPARPAKQRG
jgi:hypothetical protein